MPAGEDCGQLAGLGQFCKRLVDGRFQVVVGLSHGGTDREAIGGVGIGSHEFEPARPALRRQPRAARRRHVSGRLLSRGDRRQNAFEARMFVQLAAADPAQGEAALHGQGRLFVG